MKKPLTESRIIKYVETLKRGEDFIIDWELYHLIRENPLVRSHVEGYLNTEREEKQQLLREQQAAHREREALISANNIRHSRVVDTCYSYREARRAFYLRRKGRYNQLKYLEASRVRNERFKASNWIMFNGSVMGHRKNQAYNWCADLQDADYVISQIKDPLDPWKGVRWPWYSACRINPIPTDPDLTLRYRPEVFETQSSLLALLKHHKQEVKRLTLELNNHGKH